jgi:hypothetical protein
MMMLVIKVKAQFFGGNALFYHLLNPDGKRIDRQRFQMFFNKAKIRSQIDQSGQCHVSGNAGNTVEI